MKPSICFDAPERCCCGEPSIRYRCRFCGKIRPQWPYRSDVVRWVKQFLTGALFALLLWFVFRH